jgi:hypothetical protein
MGMSGILSLAELESRVKEVIDNQYFSVLVPMVPVFLIPSIYIDRYTKASPPEAGS